MYSPPPAPTKRRPRRRSPSTSPRTPPNKSPPKSLTRSPNSPKTPTSPRSPTRRKVTSPVRKLSFNKNGKVKNMKKISLSETALLFNFSHKMSPPKRRSPQKKKKLSLMEELLKSLK